MDRLGIDIGSKTIKVALTSGDDGQLVYSCYIRHFSKVKYWLQHALHDAVWKHGDRQVQVTVTGSAGFRVAELFDIPFVQEVVALKTAVTHFVPEADVILEMGGEDTKLVYLTGVPEQRMNTICAGGTGGFIDMMAGLMGQRNEDMQRLALGAQTIYPIASRCAVFAQSDVRPLLNAGAKKEDIAMSVLHAVCTQAVAGLSAGRPIKGTVVLLGGPFHHIPVMRDAFCQVTGIDKKHALIPVNAHLFVVQGAALAKEKSEPMLLSNLEKQVSEADFTNEEGIHRLPVLFNSAAEYQQFKEEHARCKIPRTHLIDSSKNLFLGIDAGSTTMKMALIDETGALVAYEYDWNEGDVTSSLTWMLKRIYRQMNGRWIPEKVLRRSCIVGYGEDFCRAAYGIDEGEVETVAHLRAATALEPDVDFLMDIGGQDIKCFYVEDGAITDIVLNEACSSGCGSLFDSVARSMRKTKEGLAEEALFAKYPVDLGTRCSTFMDSRVKHAQKEGATQGDIAAGIAYSTARNALFKVVRQPDFTKVGKHIVVQGGAFANDALLRAFELETGVQAVRPDLSQLMGAWGAALLARDRWMAIRSADPELAESLESGLLKYDEIDRMRIRKSNARCDICGNNCKLMVTRFFQDRYDKTGRTYVTGNRCERGALAYGAAAASEKRPPNMIKVKNALLKSYDRPELHAQQADAGKPVVGIPKVLALYESYPFWHTFFAHLGYEVLAGRESGDEVYRCGMGSIPAEGACYPSKLAHGHAVDLAQRGAQVIFAPYMGMRVAREGLLGLPLQGVMRDCPLVENMPSMLADNAQDTALEQVRFVSPDLVYPESDQAFVDELEKALASAGLVHLHDEVLVAFKAAREEYKQFFDKLAAQSAKILERVDAGEFPGALVAGHAYHADPGINHGIDELLCNLGYAVLEQLDYDFANHKTDDEFVWSPNRDLFYAAAGAEEHPNLQLIIPRSFGCGIDAIAADSVHDLLHEQGRIYAELKLDQIVDLAAVRIRLRSLDYATRQRNGEITAQSIARASKRIDYHAENLNEPRFLPNVNLGRVEISGQPQRRRTNVKPGRADVTGINVQRTMGRGLNMHEMMQGSVAQADGAPERISAGLGGFHVGDVNAALARQLRTPAGKSTRENGSAAETVLGADGFKVTREDIGMYHATVVDQDENHDSQIAEMAKIGYEFVIDRTKSLAYLNLFRFVIFNGPEGARYFESWDEVDQFIAGEGGAKEGDSRFAAAALTEEMRQLGFQLITDGNNMFAGTVDTKITFQDHGNQRSFNTWEDVRDFVEARVSKN